MPLSRAQKQAQTRRALLDAAVETFIERGLEGASIEAISERAGFTRGAFYAHFSSKQQIYVEVLQDRLYSIYRRMAEEQAAAPVEGPSARQTGEQLARVQAHSDGAWLLPLWLSLLAQAAVDDELRQLARGFWSTNRQLIGQLLARAASQLQVDLPAPPERMASAMIALDIGLAIQHHIDPDAVPLDAYPELFEALFDVARWASG